MYRCSCVVQCIRDVYKRQVWYTNDIPFRGTPQANVGVPDGLVLRVVRNGDMIQEATHITPLKKGKDVLPQSWGKSMDAADYQYTCLLYTSGTTE